MRTVTFKSLLSGIAAKSGLDPNNLMSHEKAALAEYVNDATRWCWDYYPWPEAVRFEQRFFRPDWSASGTYVIGSEVFYKAGQKYYQCISAGPTSVPGANVREWAELTELYPAEEWTESGLYKAGARVHYLGDVYQCISDGASTSAYNVNFQYDKITPGDPTYWTRLKPFHRYVGWQQVGQKTIGTPISVYVYDPLVANSEPIQFTQRQEGIASKKLDATYNSVYIEYREAPPVFTGSSWAAGAYAAGDKVYHDQSGECYEASVATSAEPPSSDWTKIDAPDFLAPAIKTLAYADWLAGDGQHEKCELQRAHGLEMLVRELDKAEYSTDQNRPYLIGPKGTSRLGTSQKEEAPSTADLSTEVAAARSGVSTSRTATGALISDLPNIAVTSVSTNNKAKTSTSSLLSAIDAYPINFEPPEIASKTSYPSNLSIGSSFTAMGYGGSSANDILVGERTDGSQVTWEITFRMTVPMRTQHWGVGGGFGSTSEYIDNLWNPHLGNPPGVTGWGNVYPTLDVELFNVTTTSTHLRFAATIPTTASTVQDRGKWSPFSEARFGDYAFGGNFHKEFLLFANAGPTDVLTGLSSCVGNQYKVIIRTGGVSSATGYNGMGAVVSGGQHVTFESSVFSPAK